MSDSVDLLALLSQYGAGPDELGGLLAEAGHAPTGASLTALVPSAIGTGQVGENIRCALTWDVDSDIVGPPTSVVVKLPSVSEQTRATAQATETYIHEVGFYRDVQYLVGLRTPRCFHVAENRAANSFVLVMEDISPARQGDQVLGATIEQAGLAVEAIAGLHGPTWERRDLLDLDWLSERTEARTAELVGYVQLLWDGFRNRIGPSLGADVLATGEWVVENASQLMADRGGPHCLVHGDFRLDNLLFGTEPAPPITTVDWQTVTWGNGPTDVAYFLSGALPRSVLREHESVLIDRYLAGLSSHGVALDPKEFRTLYRLGAPSGYIMAIIASQLVAATARGDAMFAAMATGSAHLMADVDVQGML